MWRRESALSVLTRQSNHVFSGGQMSFKACVRFVNVCVIYLRVCALSAFVCFITFELLGLTLMAHLRLA